MANDKSTATDPSPALFNLKLVQMSAIALFTASMIYITAHNVAPSFGYAGYIPRPTSTAELALALSATLAVALMCPTRITLPSDGAYIFLVLTIAIPIFWVSRAYGRLQPSEYTVEVLSTVTGFAAMRVILFGRRQSRRLLKIKPRAYWTGLALILAASFGALWLSGLRPSTSVFSDVYAQRADYLESVGSSGVYIMGFIVDSVLPVFVSIGLYRRKILPIAIGATGYVLSLALTGQKSFLIGFILSIAAYLLVRGSNAPGWGWPLVFVGAMWTGALIDMVTSTINGTSLLVRRAITTAGLNTSFYFDFFSHNPIYELRHSIFSFLGASPYSLPPANIIGTEYYGSSLTAANANLVADGYANFRVIGAILACVIFAVFLRVFDNFTMHVPLKVSLPCLTMILVAVANTAILTVLLTHGAIALGIIVSTLPEFSSSNTGGSKDKLHLSPQMRPTPRSIQNLESDM